MLEVERFQNPWKNPSSWSLVLRDLDSACVKEHKELHVYYSSFCFAPDVPDSLLFFKG